MLAPEDQGSLSAITSRHCLPWTAEESSRADLYGLCASLLLDVPDGVLLASLGAAAPDLTSLPGNPLQDALGKLAAAASITPQGTVRDQFDTLFTSTGTPVINPYASVYLAGFMNDKPLARLRGDLAQLGLARVAGRGEAEDHLGVLCEIMRVMIGSEQLRQPLWRQQQFFFRHIHPWYAACLTQVRQTAGATFYGRAAHVVHTFLEIEAQAFTIDHPASQTEETS
ncbi:TorD/DmsD family molecular chaperone [Massilia sp. TSP1-1-2]|uniref:TorD/DmsD family molecular chaperone n=1 Tax=unclassified Massilia TaxID=2609279 RepID=UPI003CF920AB